MTGAMFCGAPGTRNDVTACTRSSTLSVPLTSHMNDQSSDIIPAPTRQGIVHDVVVAERMLRHGHHTAQ